MNWEQLKGIVERVVTVAVTYAVGKNWVPAGISADLIALVVLAGSVLWGWKVNTQSSLVASTAALPKVEKVVVSDPKMAVELTAPGATVSTK